MPGLRGTPLAFASVFFTSKEDAMPASTTSPKTKVPFYGHARQYHNIKREIDDAFHAVMESEAYVMGPTLARKGVGSVFWYEACGRPEL
jgi:hypothetical protein